MSTCACTSAFQLRRSDEHISLELGARGLQILHRDSLCGRVPHHASNSLGCRLLISQEGGAEVPAGRGRCAGAWGSNSADLVGGRRRRDCPGSNSREEVRTSTPQWRPGKARLPISSVRIVRTRACAPLRTGSHLLNPTDTLGRRRGGHQLLHRHGVDFEQPSPGQQLDGFCCHGSGQASRRLATVWANAGLGCGHDRLVFDGAHRPMTGLMLAALSARKVQYEVGWGRWRSANRPHVSWRPVGRKQASPPPCRAPTRR